MIYVLSPFPGCCRLIFESFCYGYLTVNLCAFPLAFSPVYLHNIKYGVDKIRHRVFWLLRCTAPSLILSWELKPWSFPIFSFYSCFCRWICCCRNWCPAFGARTPWCCYFLCSSIPGVNRSMFCFWSAQRWWTGSAPLPLKSGANRSAAQSPPSLLHAV